ncbi:MAG TPA: glutaminase A, partial [Deltaproteobacteria bacterium]|nr:glutaminase A [Deltaproteobacteria bacterium]
HALDNNGTGSVSRKVLIQTLKSAGLHRDDERLKAVFAAMEPTDGPPLDFDQFADAVSSAGSLVERAVRGNLVVPEFAEFESAMQALYTEVSPNREGKQADYIPPLAEVDPEGFGVALVTVDGQRLSLGDAGLDFSIQSTCKPFNYCFALEELGEETVHRHIGREPSGRGFNAYVLQADNRPHNPMINAGAIMCASLIQRKMPTFKRFRHVVDCWRALTGGSAPRFDAYMAMEEDRTGDRNRALAYMMKNEGAFPGGEDFEDSDLRSALELYFKTCSLELNTNEMAMAAATLANGGINPATGERALKRDTVRSCLSLMYSCGMYDFSGEFAFSIGVPAKSGVGGAVILVVPGLFGLCIWSPRLDAVGNSVRGVDFATRLVRKYALHVFDGLKGSRDRIDPRVPYTRWRASQTAEALWAASTGDLGTLRRLHVAGFNLNQGDYDRRTALHLAAADGHADVVEFLLKTGVDSNALDRWNGTALNDAILGGHTGIEAILRAAGCVVSDNPHPRGDVDPSAIAGSTGVDPVDVVALLWAAADADKPGLHRLLANGVPMDVADYDGRTALHLAAAEGHTDVAEYLVAHGAVLSTQDRWGSTASEEARRNGHNALAKKLAP